MSTTMTRWEPQLRMDPFRALDDMTREMSRMLSSFGRWPASAGEEALKVADWSPAVDIHETDKEYLVKAEIPEVKKEDVKVSVEDGVLMIQGERKVEKEEKGKKYHRTERLYGSFLRSFTIPADADETKILADFKDGMLYIHMPKSEKAKPKAIEVKVT